HTEATLDPLRPLSAESASLGSGRFLALYEMGQQLLEQREPAQVLRTIHEAIVRHLQPDRAALLAVSADGSYRPLFAHELDSSAPPRPCCGPTTRCAASRGAAPGSSCAARRERARSSSPAPTPPAARGREARTCRCRSPPSRRRWWSPSCSATCAGRSPRRSGTRRVGWSWPTAACCSSTRW